MHSPQSVVTERRFLFSLLSCERIERARPLFVGARHPPIHNGPQPQMERERERDFLFTRAKMPFSSREERKKKSLLFTQDQTLLHGLPFHRSTIPAMQAFTFFLSVLSQSESAELAVGLSSSEPAVEVGRDYRGYRRR